MTRKQQSYFTIPLLVLLLIGAGWYYVAVIQVRAEYNRIVTELVDESKHEEAAAAFEPLYEKAAGEIKQTIRHDMAEAYRMWGDGAGVSAAASLKCYQRAFELDPEVLGPTHMRLLQSQ